jgi:hypothetical protein
MDATELIDITTLRLGNLLLYNNEPHYVSFLSLDIDDEYQELIGVTPFGKRSGEKNDWIRALGDSLKPIPITEEWLIKCGFEKGPAYEPEGITYKKRIGISPVAISTTERYRYLWIDEKLIHHNHQHVHQLQNLYFALTGEELTIKKD